MYGIVDCINIPNRLPAKLLRSRNQWKQYTMTKISESSLQLWKLNDYFYKKKILSPEFKYPQISQTNTFLWEMIDDQPFKCARNTGKKYNHLKSNYLKCYIIEWTELQLRTLEFWSYSREYLQLWLAFLL